MRNTDFNCVGVALTWFILLVIIYKISFCAHVHMFECLLRLREIKRKKNPPLKPKNPKKGSTMRIAYVLGRIRTQILALVLLLIYVNRSLYHCAILFC